jgi:indolepyruvate ferredoxin oxidoreductase beta subunit
MMQLSKRAWVINASEIALRLGSALITNIVMTGALLGTELLPIERTKVEDQLKSTFKGEKLALNIEAFDLGYEAVKGAQ